MFRGWLSGRNGEIGSERHAVKAAKRSTSRLVELGPWRIRNGSALTPLGPPGRGDVA
jgi:hypothetical protein